MPEYECAVTNAHRRLYGVPQEHVPVCCGKPMVLKPGSSQTAAPAAADPLAVLGHEVATVPQKEKNWWQLWK